MSLRIGILLPTRETAMAGRRDAPSVVRFAVEAEQAGFDSVWVGDSLLARSRAEPLSVLASVASVTERVELGAAALVAPAAAQAATVDQLSSGRLVLGVAFGSPVPESRREFDAVSVPFAGRGEAAGRDGGPLAGRMGRRAEFHRRFLLGRGPWRGSAARPQERASCVARGRRLAERLLPALRALDI